METSSEGPEEDADDVNNDGEVKNINKCKLNEYELMRKKNVEDLKKRVQLLKDR